MNDAFVGSLVAALLVSGASAQSVWIVDESGGGDFASVQAAVDAAVDGDTIRIVDAPSSEFIEIVGKGMHVIDDDPLPILGQLAVRFLPPDSVYTHAGPSERRIVLEGNAGHVLFRGLNARNGAEVSGSQDVVFVDCSIEGATSSSYCYPPVDGGPGLEVSASSVALYGSSVRGGHGTDGYCPFPCNSAAGNGGPGILVNNGSFVFATRTTFLGGAPGYDDGCGAGEPGKAVDLDATSELALAAHDDLAITNQSVTGEGRPFDVLLSGEPGGFAVLLLSDGLRPRYLGATAVGMLHLDSPLALHPLGPIPADGLLVTTLEAPALPFGVEAVTIYLQAFRSGGGSRYLSNPTELTVLAP